MRETIVGTGFFCTEQGELDAKEFLRIWEKNTVGFETICVDNSDTGLGLSTGMFDRVVRINHNLGHVGSPWACKSQLNGWSLSWLIPAMIAYSEDCDFVYKEQDCLAFGDWLPAIRTGRASFGTHTAMPCEQSLFWIERDFIPDFVSAYTGIGEADFCCVPEDKFVQVMKRFNGDVKQFSIGVGRGRPLPKDLRDAPWYAQKLTSLELQRLFGEGLI